MAEILKYNQHREELNAKAAADLEKQKQKMQQPKKKFNNTNTNSFQPPSMMHKPEDQPKWK